VGVGRAGELTRAVFVDRDGVINEPAWDPLDGRYESPVDPSDVVLVEGAIGGLRELAVAGYLIVVASNQPAAAKGKASLDQLRAVHERVVGLLADSGIALDDWRYCFHHPDGSDPELRGACECRKPAPGMLLDAAAEHAIDLAASWMVGDSDTDVLAGQRAGCRTVLVQHVLSKHRRGSACADAIVRNLAAAAAFIVDEPRARLPST
jgi:D-glycero-D-manno-heptose 1,7-bisphosphate phosphatase